MLTLNISSHIDIPETELTKLFADKKIACQVTKTTNSVPNADGTYRVEKGYRLLIFDTDGATFRDTVWNDLKDKLALRCAFVKYRDSYMGCVMNWPGVFTKSNCPGSLHKNKSTRKALRRPVIPKDPSQWSCSSWVLRTLASAIAAVAWGI